MLDKNQSFWAPWSLEIQPTQTAKCWTLQVLVSAFTQTLSTHFAFFPLQQNNNNSTGSCESTQEGAGRQTKAITHRFTLRSNWHYSIHQAHKRGMETAQWQDTSLVLICCWMAPLSVFFTPLPPPFALTINKQAEERAARKKSNTTLNECSQSLNQKCPRRYQIWVQMNAPAAVPSFWVWLCWTMCARYGTSSSLTDSHLAAVRQKDINLEKEVHFVWAKRGAMIIDTTGFVTGSKRPRVMRPTWIKVSVRVRKGAVLHETLLTLSLCESLSAKPLTKRLCSTCWVNEDCSV